MIQRIQSVYWGVVAILGLLLFFMPYAEIVNANLIFKLNGIYNVKTGFFMSNSFFITIVNDLSIILAVVIIFLYKNRRMQIKLSNILIALLVMLTIMLFAYAEVMPGALIKQNIEGLSFRLGAILPIVAIVAAFLARRGVVKDDDLIRSTDRIR